MVQAKQILKDTILHFDIDDVLLCDNYYYRFKPGKYLNSETSRRAEINEPLEFSILKCILQSVPLDYNKTSFKYYMMETKSI